MLSSDTLQTIVRNLSTGKPSLDEGADKPLQAFGFGEIDLYEPGMASLSFALGNGPGPRLRRATMSTLRFAHRGTVRVTTQAVVRRPDGVSHRTSWPGRQARTAAGPATPSSSPTSTGAVSCTLAAVTSGPDR
jgi:hypothetical protein